GAIGGDRTHEFQVLADSGEDVLVHCDQCDYAANQEKATTRRNQELLPTPENAPAMEQVSTPDKKTIEDVATFLGIKEEQSMKMLIYSVNQGEYLVSLSIRGDLEVNEIKLKNFLQAESIEIPAEDQLIEEHGLTIGYLGLPGFSNEAIKMHLADYSVVDMQDCVCGANREDTHVLHVFPARDMKVDQFLDASFARATNPCPKCESGLLKERRGIEVGQVFQLGDKYSKAMGLSVLSKEGRPVHPLMGCYGIGISRTAAAAIEQNHDDDGILWPYAIAPYHVTILCLDPQKQESADLARELHDQLKAAGIDVLVDDRKERPGIKFKDADLIGCPIRVTIGAKGLKQGVVEVKQRNQPEAEKVALDQAGSHLVELCQSYQ
ncbi:MAG: proline--tRNA ligase, partial [SAR324 cluster bacterium]